MSKIQRIKILSLGDANVGKSCLIKRYCESRFVPEYVATIGVDYGVKPWYPDSQVEVRVNFWDLAGEDVYFHVRNEFYQDTEGLLLVFDVTQKSTFEHIESWLEEMSSCTGKPKSELLMECAAVLVGNKSDVKGSQQVSTEEAENYARQIGVKYFETSAASGNNVDDLFEHLFSSTASLKRGGDPLVKEEAKVEF